MAVLRLPGEIVESLVGKRGCREIGSKEVPSKLRLLQLDSTAPTECSLATLK